MDDFVALLMAVAACVAAVMVVRLAVFCLAFVGADGTWLALGPTAQAVAGLAAAFTVYRRAVRSGSAQPAT
jgi:hypothetical protein